MTVIFVDFAKRDRASARKRTRHAAVSRSRANSAKARKVTPALRAVFSDASGSHAEEGIDPRYHHLRTACEFRCPSSLANSSLEGQSEMMERYELNSAMSRNLGQPGTKVKDVISHHEVADILRDNWNSTGHHVPMATPKRKTPTPPPKRPRLSPEDQVRDKELMARLKQIRGSRTQETWAKVLGVERDNLAKWETRSAAFSIPPWLWAKIADTAGVDLRWLLEGEPE